MKTTHTEKTDDLHEIIDQKITALVLEMENADWPTSDIARAIHDVVKTRWLDSASSLEEASRAVSKNFVSDGNEG